MKSARSVSYNYSSADTVSEQLGEAGSSRSMCLARRALALGCPYFEAMEEADVKDLLLSNGEARLRLMHWFAGRLHPQLKDLLFSSESTTSLPTIPKLTSALADFGICRREDYELVQGKTSVSKQLLFLETLFDLIEIAHSEDDNSFNDSLTPQPNEVPLKFERCSNFIDNLCSQEDLSSVFATSLSLLPPGIAKAASTDFTTAPTSKTKSSAVTSSKKSAATGNAVSLSDLTKIRQELQSLIEGKQTELEQILQSHEYAPLNTSALEICHKNLSVSLNTLSQLIGSFCHSYEAEIQPWTKRDPPAFNQLGPTCKRIDMYKQQLDKLLQCIEVMECSLSRLDALQPVASVTQGHMSELLPSIQKTFKDCVEVMTVES